MKIPSRTIPFLLRNWLRVITCCLIIPEALAGGELVFRSHITNPDARADAVVQITDPRQTIDIPQGSFLEYEILFSPENVSFGGGVCVLTRKGSTLKDPCPKDQNGITTHREGSANDLERLAKGKWYHRRISLDFLAGVPATEILVVASAANPKGVGFNEVHYRNICLTDADGRELADLMPKSGSLPYPLLALSPYVRDVSLELPGVVSGSFQPDLYLITSAHELSGHIALKNFDPAKPATVSYALSIEPLSGDGHLQPLIGKLELKPGEDASVAVRLPALEPGNYRSRLRLISDGRDSVVEGFAITSLTKEALAERRRPFSKDAFGMGAVSLIGGDSSQTLPAVRELGANFYQIRLDWAQIEPEPGKYDTSCLDPYLDMARRCGLWLEIDFYSGYPGYSVPRWYRDQSMVSSTGRSDVPAFCPLAYWTSARKEGLKALKSLLEKCGKTDDVVAWNAWQGGNMDSFYLIHGPSDQVGIQDYSQSSQEKFRDYLRVELKLSPADASKRYNMPIGSLSDIKQPTPSFDRLNLSPLWRDFMAYRSWTVEMVQKEASQIIKEASPQTVPEYMYGGGLGYLGLNGNDYDAGVRNAVAFGGSIHHTASPGPENQLYLGTARRKFGTQFSIETAGTPATPRDHQHAIFELLSQNASAYSYIQWTGMGLIPAPKPDYGFGEFRPSLERISGAKPVGNSMAVVFPYANMIIDPINKLLPGTKAAVAFIRRLETVGYDADVYTDQTTNVSWSDYPVVVAAFSSCLSSSFVDAMVKYVAGGGRLILLSSTGEYAPGDETGRFELIKKLGCTLLPDEKNAQNGKPKACFNKGDLSNTEVEINNWHAMPALPAKSEIWAVDKGGAPAVASWPFGSGAVMMWAGWPDWKVPFGTSPVAYSKRGSTATAVTTYPTVHDKVLQQFGGIGLPMSCSTPDVLFALRKKGDDYFLILFNNAEQETAPAVSVPLPQGKYNAFHLTRMSNLGPVTFAKNDAQFKVDLEALEVAVIQISTSPIQPPLLDFPLRSRKAFPPSTALSGDALKNSFQGVSSARRDVNGTIEVNPGAVLNVKFPSPGQYKLLFNAPRKSTDFTIRDSSGALLPVSTKISTSGVSHAINFLARAEGETISFPNPCKIDSFDLSPRFCPLGPALVSPVSDNPGPFPGQKFLNSDPVEDSILKTGKIPTDEGWSSVTPDSEGCIKFPKADRKSAGLAYAAWSINSPVSRKAVLGCGADYGLKLWLNGALLLDSTKMPREGPPKDNEFTVPIQLQQGVNILLAKIVPGADGWFVQMNTNSP